MSLNIAVVGATGVVGRTMLTVLSERRIPVKEIIPVASARSAGSQIDFNGGTYQVITVEEALTRPVDIALFSAGKQVSLEYAPRFAERRAVVIDNSSAWRMDPAIKLIVPEINGHLLGDEDRIIANPNCSTIQMVMVLAPLHALNPIKRLVISTYQSVSGTGLKAVKQLEGEASGTDCVRVYPHQIYKNCLPHCDLFSDDGYTLEELKLVNETRKILGDDRIGITATAVRVPVIGGHSESVNIEFERPIPVAEVREVLERTKGVKVVDDPQGNLYPMPIDAQGSDDVFAGRIRRDLSNPNAVNIWIVADNLRKGAATNAVQIAELLLEKLPAESRPIN